MNRRCRVGYATAQGVTKSDKRTANQCHITSEKKPEKEEEKKSWCNTIHKTLAKGLGKETA